MFNFTVYRKDNGKYTDIKTFSEIAVFPLSFSNLLDEQLDEMKLIVRNSSVKCFTPLTEFRIDIRQSGTVKKSLYMIVANDNPREFPNGSNKYTHELYLIERTKLLEGILCQSISFTNALGVGRGQQSALSSYSGSDTSRIPPIVKEIYKTPSNPVVVKCPEYLGAKMMQYFEENSEYLEFKFRWGQLSVTHSNQEQIYDSEFEDFIIDTQETIRLYYEMNIEQYSFATSSTSILNIKIEYYIAPKQAESYPLARWTITDCVNRVLDLAEPVLEGETPRFVFNNTQAQKYSKIFAPEFTMTQCTLREQLKVIGGHIQAEARLGGYDENGIYQENMIFFDEYGGAEQSNLANQPYINKIYSQDISQYCTDVQTNVSNLVNSLNYAQGVVIDPYKDADRTLRTDTINLKLSESTSKVYTQLPIYKVTKVECGMYKADKSGYQIPLTDITPYVYESYEYSSVLSSYEGTYPYSKSFAIYYTQGQKGLDGLFFKSENPLGQYWAEYSIVNILNEVTGGNWKDAITKDFPLLTFRISYIPMYEAKFSHNKQLVISGDKKFTQIYNQGENVVETTYYGEHIKGVAQRLGNVEQTRTYIFKDIDLIPKVAQCIDDYVISSVSTEIQYGYIKCTVALSKDFNRISQYVGINSNKRIAEVSEKQAYKRDVLIKDYVVVGNREENDAWAITDTKFAVNSFDIAYENQTPPITCALCLGRTKNNDLLKIIRLPVVSSAFGNSMVFSWQYKDNYSAGERVAPFDYEEDDKSKVAYWQTDVPYCDYYGRIWKYHFRLFNDADFSPEQAFTPETKVGISTNPVFDMGEKFYKMRKDSREIPTFNYEIEFVTNRNDLIIGSALASSNGIVGTAIDNVAKVYLFNRKINKFEKDIDLNEATDVVGLDISAANEKISFSLQGYEFESWVIAHPVVNGNPKKYQTEEGDIIEVTEKKYGGEVMIACNKSSRDYDPNNKTETIYFTGKHDIYN